MTPINRCGWRSFCLRLQRRVQTGEDTPGVGFVDCGLGVGGEVRGGVYIAPGVVVVETGLGIDAADRADHLAGEEDVPGRYHLGQQVDAWLVVDAGVEVNVVEEKFGQQRLLHFLRKAAEASPVIRHRTAAMRYQE